MNFTRQQHQSHEITADLGGSAVFCAWVPGIRFLFTDVPLPDHDGDRPIGSSTFSPAASFPAGWG
jgi:hypothetical protein